MRHRVFIAINLPDDLKEDLLNFRDKWPDLPVRWARKDNLHITLTFLGYLSDEEILEVLRITKEVVQKHKSFSINLKRVCYGPPNKPPRMIWVEGEKSEEMIDLKKDLENSLMNSIGFDRESKFMLHITLGRINIFEFRNMDQEERPEIEEEISLSFEVNSIEVMESQLKREGPEYEVLESFELLQD